MSAKRPPQDGSVLAACAALTLARYSSRSLYTTGPLPLQCKVNRNKLCTKLIRGVADLTSLGLRLTPLSAIAGRRKRSQRLGLKDSLLVIPSHSVAGHSYDRIYESVELGRCLESDLLARYLIGDDILISLGTFREAAGQTHFLILIVFTLSRRGSLLSGTLRTNSNTDADKCENNCTMEYSAHGETSNKTASTYRDRASTWPVPLD